MPAFIEFSYSEDGNSGNFTPLKPGISRLKIKRNYITNMDAASSLRRIVVPLPWNCSRQDHARVFRIISKGCRFCRRVSLPQAVREKKPRRRRWIGKETWGKIGWKKFPWPLSAPVITVSWNLWSQGCWQDGGEEGQFFPCPLRIVDSFSLDLMEKAQKITCRQGLPLLLRPNPGETGMSSTKRLTTEEDLLQRRFAPQPSAGAGAE